jgi:Rrf2 family cysteine metabolism transcriptional repressor
MFGLISSRMAYRTIRCTTEVLPRSAAGRVRVRWLPVKTTERVAGQGTPKRNAVCTHSTAASSEPGSSRSSGRDEACDTMKISAKAEYACLAVLALAKTRPESSSVHIREISREYGIPERYLVQILLQLKAAGLVTSTRGAAGGYRLARPASTISLSEVLFAVDGLDEARRELSSSAKRPEAAVLTPVWESVRAAERVVLDHTTIAQLAEQSSAPEWII